MAFAADHQVAVDGDAEHLDVARRRQSVGR
jgi:hypothetical protein